MTLTGGVVTASKQASVAYDVKMLETVSAVLLFGTAVLVSGAIVYASITALRENGQRWPPLTH